MSIYKKLIKKIMVSLIILKHLNINESVGSLKKSQRPAYEKNKKSSNN